MERPCQAGQTVYDGYVAAGMTAPWLPISLAPWRTEDAILGLIPTAAMFCAVATLDEAARRILAFTVMGLAVISIGAGVMQIIGGADSPLRIYEFTNRDSAVVFRQPAITRPHSWRSRSRSRLSF